MESFGDFLLTVTFEKSKRRRNCWVVKNYWKLEFSNYSKACLVVALFFFLRYSWGTLSKRLRNILTSFYSTVCHKNDKWSCSCKKIFMSYTRKQLMPPFTMYFWVNGVNFRALGRRFKSWKGIVYNEALLIIYLQLKFSYLRNVIYAFLSVSKQFWLTLTCRVSDAPWCRFWLLRFYWAKWHF